MLVPRRTFLHPDRPPSPGGRHRLISRLIGYAGAAVAAGAAVLVVLPGSPASGATAGTSTPFTFLAAGFTQTLYATGTPGIGGVAFAPNGDPLVVFGTIFDVSTTSTTTVNGSTVHTFTTASSPAPLDLGVVNGANGAIYANTQAGIYKIAATGAELAGPFGPDGTGLGITVDPQTGDLVYPDSTGNIAWVNETFTQAGTLVTGAYSDGLVFDPSGNYLFLADFGTGINEYSRTGSFVQNIPNASSPDGMAFHAGTPSFLVSNNNDGSITRYDFPTNHYTQPPTTSVFASGGFRGDLSQVGSDGCLYVTQNGTRYANGTTSLTGSLVRICPGFVPPAPVTTHLAVTNASGDFADPTTVTATLTNASTSQGIDNETVTFKLNGTETCTGTTDTTGVATCSITPGEPAGTYTLSATFAGDGSIRASAGSGTFVVNLEQTGLSYTGATSATNGQSMTLSGTLTTDDPAAGTPLPGRTVTFTLGTGATAQTCSSPTGATGSATCTISAVSQTAGSVPVSASFAGDTFYAPASASSSATVAARTGTGPTAGFGYWKTHETQTVSLLPQMLGTYAVTGWSTATAVFKANNCSNRTAQNAVGCLAAQLLAAELNVANGAATPACASSATTQATAFLRTIGYTGPAGTYALSPTQRAAAVALASTLDGYNSGSPTC